MGYVLSRNSNAPSSPPERPSGGVKQGSGGETSYFLALNVDIS